MASPVPQGDAAIKQPATTIRKRRRRAPTGGAADDCFTCAKRNVKCDRRRPYCSQCLEIGNECSGYKTQLTWGVGVASRGKLRGLSLPIAKAPPVAREPKKSPAPRPRAHSSAAYAPLSWRGQDECRVPSPRGPIDIPPPSPYHHFGQQTTSPHLVAAPSLHGHHQHHHHHQHAAAAGMGAAAHVPHVPHVSHVSHASLSSRSTCSPPATHSYHHHHPHHPHPHPHPHPHSHHHHHHPHHQHTASATGSPAYSLHGYDYLSMSHAGSASPMPQSSWGSIGYSPSIIHSPDMAPRYTKFPLHISTDALSTSVESVGSEVDYLSPLSQSYQRDELPFSHSPSVMYDAYPAPNSSPICHSPPPALVLDHCRAPTSYPGLVFSTGEPGLGLHSHLDPFETHHLGHKLMREYDSLSDHHLASLPAFPF